MQRDLFPSGIPRPPAVAPRTEPRLWVRRLVVWREPGSILQEVRLRPGLNIIWSPDAGGANRAIGHGAGKTLFCRLLRYCLGEDRYAPTGQRHRVWRKLPHGYVGAEVRLDGQSWHVVRALGVRHRDYVLDGGSFDGAFDGSVEPASGTERLRQAITRALLPDVVPLMPASVGEVRAWPTVLAWLTRDQECRFAHLLEWRAPESDSESPVRRIPADDRLAAVRAVLRLVEPGELQTQQQAAEHEASLKKLQATITSLERRIAWLHADVAEQLGMRLGESWSALTAASLQAEAASRLELASGFAGGTDSANAARIRSEYREALTRREACGEELAAANASLGIARGSLTQLRSEYPTVSAEHNRNLHPVCPICEVPISRALADGCKISCAQFDPAASKLRLDNLRGEIERATATVGHLEQEAKSKGAALAQAAAELTLREAVLNRLDQVLASRSKAVREAERLADDASRCVELIGELQHAQQEAAASKDALEKIRAKLGEHRAAVAGAVQRVSERFDSLLRDLVPEMGVGEVRLDGRGLSLRAEMGGLRSTAAIDSLKIVAFDLAALLTSLDGCGWHPGFLVHDSPREADLGGSIYERLFEVAHGLEARGDAPLFQYVLTTTTAPPRKFARRPWLCLELRGAPADARLLRTDL